MGGRAAARHRRAAAARQGPAHHAGAPARIVLGTVERFCYSADEQIGGAHVPPVNGVDPASFAELTWRIVPWAERAWHDIRAIGGALPFRHDHYLKLWQLTRPRIDADYLMFDEAQDANPVIVAVVQGHGSAEDRGRRLLPGHLRVARRGRRAGDLARSMRLHLSQSFRFGPAVADEAKSG